MLFMPFVWSPRLKQWSLAIAACAIAAGVVSCVARNRGVAQADNVLVSDRRWCTEGTMSVETGWCARIVYSPWHR